MTSDDFRRIALELPETVESSHMGHPDFRKSGKIFATLHYPDERWGMVKLPPPDQQELVRTRPSVFVPSNGAWGRRGSTNVRLEAADASTVEQALRLAWSNAALSSKKSAPGASRPKSRAAR